MSARAARAARAGEGRQGSDAPAGADARPGAAGSALLFAMAIVAGSTIPVQARLNSALAERSGDPTLAAVASFAAGLVLVAAVTVLAPAGRRGLRAVRPALAAGRVRWWYLLAGTIGGAMVFSQATTVGLIGVAVFTVAVVTGQLIGGMVVDRLGLTPAGVRRMTPRRLAGAALALACVVLVVAPQLGARGDGGPPLWLLVALAPLAVGLATSIQQTLNARQAAAYGSVLPVTTVNFVAGTGILALVHLGGRLGGGVGGTLPGDWWLYLGGPMGVVFIAFSAYLVPRVGAFLTMLGLVSGKLLGSLAVDALAPVGEVAASPWTVVGTLGALAAVVLASGAARPARKG